MQRQYRLKSKKSFNYIYKNGKSISNPYLTLVYTKSKYDLKIGFSVSKKIGGSVVRNKVKRRLKEICRGMVPNITNHFNYIVVARPKITELSFSELHEQVKALFLKAGMYHE